MPYLADRVKDTTTTTGTGALTLANSAPTGYQTCATAYGAVTVIGLPYCISSSGAEWEVGYGTFNGTTGFTRDLVTGSSNSNALVNFSAGTKDFFIDASASVVGRAGLGRSLAQSNGIALP